MAQGPRGPARNVAVAMAQGHRNRGAGRRIGRVGRCAIWLVAAAGGLALATPSAVAGERGPRDDGAALFSEQALLTSAALEEERAWGVLVTPDAAIVQGVETAVILWDEAGGKQGIEPAYPGFVSVVGVR